MVWKLPFAVADLDPAAHQAVAGPSTDRSSTLPPNHFLSQTSPDFFFSSLNLAENGRIDTSSLGAADFDVDVASGFLPPDPPILRLPDLWASWEDCWRASTGLKVADVSERAVAWRRSVDELAVLPTTPLDTLPLLRRAHVVLGFIAHRYMASLPAAAGSAGGKNKPPSVPAPIAIPWQAVSDRLDMPAFLTYADVVLWNWSLRDPSAGLTLPNLQIVDTFTDTDSERHFFLTSALIELQGVQALQLMRASYDEAFVNDALARERIASYLFALSQVIADFTDTMDNIRTECIPEQFFGEVRHWFSSAEWSYPSSDHSVAATIQKHSGPSTGQSSLVHSLDIFLGIDHSPPKPTSGAQPSKDQFEESFMLKMSTYMPHYHRLFLLHLQEQTPTIRSIALNSPKDSALRSSYDACIEAVKKFREMHMKIVWLYIISPAKKAAAAAAVESDSGSGLKGTGGTDIKVFLDRTRARTMAARLGDG